jgi:hypothetical protein
MENSYLRFVIRLLGSDYPPSIGIGLLLGLALAGSAEFVGGALPRSPWAASLGELNIAFFMAAGLLLVLTPKIIRGGAVPEQHRKLFDLIQEPLRRGRITKRAAEQAYWMAIEKTVKAFEPVESKELPLERLGAEALQEATQGPGA